MDLATLGYGIDSSQAVSASKNLKQMADAATVAEQKTQSLTKANHALTETLRQTNQAMKDGAQAQYGGGYGVGALEISLKRAAKEQAMLDAVARQAKQHGTVSDILGAKSAGSGLKELEQATTGVNGSMLATVGAAGLVGAGLQVLTAIVATGAAMVYNYAKAQDSFALSLSGVGKQTGLTVSMLNDLAEQHAATANIAVRAAKDQEAAYVRAGIKSSDVIGELVDISRAYAQVTGVDAKTANDELAKSFADPIKGVDTMIDRVGGIDGATREYIIDLARHNDLTGAQATLLGKVSSQLSGTEDHVSALTKLLNDGSNAWSNYWDSVAKGISAGLAKPGSEEKDAFNISNFNKYKGTQLGSNSFGGASNVAVPFEDYYSSFWRQQKRTSDAAMEAQKAGKDNVSLAGFSAFGSLKPTDDQRGKIKADLDAVKAYTKQTEELYKTTDHTAGGLARMQKAQDMLSQAQVAAAHKMTALDKRDAGPKTPKVPKTAEQREIDRAIDSAGKAATAIDVQNKAQGRYNDLVAAGVITTAEANRQADVTAKLSQYQQALDKSSGADKAKLTANMARLTDEIKKQQALDITKDTLAAVEVQNRQNDLLDLEATLIGKSNRERAVTIAQYQAIQDLLARGESPNSDAGRSYVSGKVSGANKAMDNALGQYIEDAKKAQIDYRNQVDLTTDTMFMSREAAAAYLKEQELINEATKQYGMLSPEQVAQIKATADAYGQTEGIKRLQEATEDWRQTIKGAFMDFAGGTQSISAGITQIILKLAEMEASKAFDKIWSGGLGQASSNLLSYLGLGGNSAYSVKSSNDGGSFSANSLGTSSNPILSFDGGGHTGYGPRSGGIDGKGGKLSITHPNEVVTDLTKGQSVPGGFDMGQAVATLAGAITAHITKTSAGISSRAVYKYDRALPTRLGSVSRLGT